MLEAYNELFGRSPQAPARSRSSASCLVALAALLALIFTGAPRAEAVESASRTAPAQRQAQATTDSGSEIKGAGSGLRIVRLPEEMDRPSIEITFTAPTTAPRGPGDKGTLIVAIEPRISAESSMLTLAIAGGASSKGLSHGDEWREVKPGRSLLDGVEIRQQAARDFGVLRKGEVRRFEFTVDFQANGVGYLALGVRTPARGPAQNSEAGVLYFLVDNETVYFSDHSVLDLRAQALNADLRRKGVSEEEIEKRIERLKRGGAKVDKKIEPPKDDSGPITQEPSSYNSVTVQGQVLFTDVLGSTHPVRFATVEIWDEEAGADELVDTTSTDGSGNYSSTVDDNDGDGTGRDFYVVAMAEGDTVSVEDIDNPGTVWSIDSLPALVDVVDGSTLTIGLTATNAQVDANNVAFEVYEAINYLSRYLADLGEPLPALVTMLYPRSTDGSSYNRPSQTITTGGTDNHDWDNLHHEYGHHIQNLYNTADSPGGPHGLGDNLCSTHGKDAGLRLAWGEAWPTFFGTTAQFELNLATLGIPNVGDTSYTDTKPVGADLTYDLEPSAGFQGESDEVSAQRLLWDLYDTANDDGDTVALPAQELWNLVADSECHTLSEFWNALVFLRTEAEKATFGEIAQDHGVGTDPTSPADGAVFAGGIAPNFQWTANLECDTGGNSRFSMRAYNAAFTSLLWASPWQPAASLTPTDSQRDLIFAGPDASLRWLVTSRDITVPETGPYYGASRVIDDDFDVPDRSPVDLILALDISSSMDSVVPGATTGLTKITLLRQAAEVFLQTWRLHQVPGDRVGVIYLNSDTSSIPAAPPVLRDLATEVDAVITDINGKGASGCTAVGGALQVGFDSFDATSMNKQVIILFSDGMQSINPFVGEEGSPERLKIMTFASGSSLPFGAFFCSTATADDLAGVDIVPDGQFLDDHGVKVHTIGVGVDGAGFQELIERVADETSALHHFTSAPDENLDIFYTNDLVSSLKTATLEVVGTSSGEVSSRRGKTLLVPVNQTAISLTVVLSWKGGEGDVEMSVHAPGGEMVSPTELKESGFYRIWKYDLPPEVGGADVGAVGNWRVSLRGSGSALKYQMTAIVDEPCFHYQFNVPSIATATGDRILLTAALTQKGKPVLGGDGVFVEVERPAEPMGNLLVEWLPRTKTARERQQGYESEKRSEIDPSKRAFHAAMKELYAQPAFVERARAKTRHKVFLADDGSKKRGDAKAGDGIYSGYLATTQIPGSYQLKLVVQVSSLCGRVTRTESTTTLVSVDYFDPERSVLAAVPLNERAYSVLVAPIDRFGNLLGPGRAEEIEIYAKGIKPIGAVRDRLDGSYEQVIEVERGHNPKVTVQARGRQLANVYFRDMLRNGKKFLGEDPKQSK